MRTLLPQLLLLALGGCATAEPSTPTPGGAVTPRTERVAATSTEKGVLAALLPRPRQPFTLRATAEHAPSLHEVVVELERATGVHFVVSDEARKVLRSSNSGLLSDLEVPPREAWRVVETMLAQNELVLAPSTGAEPVTIGVTSMRERDSTTLKARAVPIDASALDECADHPAVLFSTVVDTHPLDARQLATSMRQLFPDQRTQSILCLDGSQMMLTGLGPALLTAVRMIQESAAARRGQVDEASAGDVPAGGGSPR